MAPPRVRDGRSTGEDPLESPLRGFRLRQQPGPQGDAELSRSDPCFRGSRSKYLISVDAHNVPQKDNRRHIPFDEELGANAVKKRSRSGAACSRKTWA